MGPKKKKKKKKSGGRREGSGHDQQVFLSVGKTRRVCGGSPNRETYGLNGTGNAQHDVRKKRGVANRMTGENEISLRELDVCPLGGKWYERVQLKMVPLRREGGETE